MVHVPGPGGCDCLTMRQGPSTVLGTHSVLLFITMDQVLVCTRHWDLEHLILTAVPSS